ncbi:virulence protein SciE type [Paucibacter aquatile]|uniref:Virulence protein SciE type n=1 Tax=Kinneretia aquatilis TaxID=2070761 RepID=A0A2N8KTF0_9BURK|nr:type VI secretion system accessory protein TagJ [Paucibacter aquatile]PND36733.1 virulence protein SciE type [Paucibacter aquatile]WIV95775.1 type VI secretion system accessory protein TagJ [Paucibacter aquatile]
MAHPSPAEQALKDGDALAALKLLSEQIRSQPQDAKLRVFLFQLLCVSGQWQRALNQLNVALELDAGMLPMVQTYREAIACEALRMKVFAGEKVPMLFGEPETWVALLIEALLREGQGDVAAGQALRAQALEQAPASAGSINEQPFSWIADGDSRLGPVIEAIINGKYYWLPWNRLARVEIDPPQDLRDAIWMPAHFMFTNGGEVVGLIPTRYPDTDLAAGDALALSRATEWRERGPDSYIGLGQRLWSTDGEEFALMDVRTVVVHESADDSAAPPAPASA